MLKDLAKQSEYVDSYSFPLTRDDVESWEPVSAFFQSSPKWVDQLYRLRNCLVRPLGLKSQLAREEDFSPPFIVGQEFGDFTLYAINVNEAVLGTDDKHLNYRLSFLIERGDPNLLSVSSIVNTNNKFGQSYFFCIKQFHRVIVPVISQNMATNIDQKCLPQYFD